MTEPKTLALCFLWVALIAIIGTIIATKEPKK